MVQRVMKKGTFKRFLFDPPGIITEETGWIIGNFGIAKLSGYEITHIPTGMFVTRFDKLKWAKQFIEHATKDENWDFGKFGVTPTQEQIDLYQEIRRKAYLEMDYEK